VWVQLPRELVAARLQPLAAAEGLTFHAGSRFVSGEGLENFVRLSFAHYDTPLLVEGVARMARAVARERMSD
jgi:DNA-binding transcriptional MocR family regulator